MMISCRDEDSYFGPSREVHETQSVFPSVCSKQCNDAANRRLMESHAEDVFLLALPLGLDLRITPTLVNSIQNEVNKQSTPSGGAKPSNLGLTSPIKVNELGDGEKLRASCVNASTIKIGSWEWKPVYASDVVMKIYFAKRRVVWEFLQENRRRKNKIEMRWNDIIGIRVTMEPEVLELELECPPSFMEEMEPHPKKHTMWLTANDFTGGQASICRTHLVTFHPGTLEKHMQKLFMAEPRLLELSTQGFPTMPSPHFERRPTAFCPPGFNGGFQPFGLPPYLPTKNNFPTGAVDPSLQQLPSPMSADQHFLFVPWSTSNADGSSGGQVHGIASSNVAPSTLVVLEAQGGNYDQRKLKAIEKQLLNEIESSWIAKQSSESIDSWNAMLNVSMDGTRGSGSSSSTVDDNAGGNENVPFTPDSQFYQTAASGMPPSLSHVRGIENPPHYEIDSGSTVEDYVTLNENVPIIPDSQFYQTASGMPPSLSQVQLHQNSGNLAYDLNAYYNSFGGDGAHLIREQEEKLAGG